MLSISLDTFVQVCHVAVALSAEHVPLHEIGRGYVLRPATYSFFSTAANNSTEEWPRKAGLEQR